MQTLDPSGLDSDVLKESSKVTIAWEIHPEVNAVENLDSDLVLLHKLQASPLPIVRCIDEIKYYVRVVRRHLIGNEASIEVDRVREAGSKFCAQKYQKVVEQVLPMLVPRKRCSYVVKRTIVNTRGKKAVLL